MANSHWKGRYIFGIQYIYIHVTLAIKIGISWYMYVLMFGSIFLSFYRAFGGYLCIYMDASMSNWIASQALLLGILCWENPELFLFEMGIPLPFFNAKKAPLSELKIIWRGSFQENWLYIIIALKSLEVNQPTSSPRISNPATSTFWLMVISNCSFGSWSCTKPLIGQGTKKSP